MFFITTFLYHFRSNSQKVVYHSGFLLRLYVQTYSIDICLSNCSFVIDAFNLVIDANKWYSIFHLFLNWSQNIEKC